MAYAKGFEQDIFISYAQVDNTPMVLNGRETRWVTHLKEQLQMRVDQRLGRIGRTKIWMDLDDLSGELKVTPTIDQAISNTAALVAVFSNGYLASEWCRTEIRDFIKSAGDTQRLFLVRLADIPLGDRPEEIQDIIGFDFYDEDHKVELDPFGSEYAEQLF